MKKIWGGEVTEIGMYGRFLRNGTTVTVSTSRVA